MTSEELLSQLKEGIANKMRVVAVGDGFLIQLPFNNYRGEPIEIGVRLQDNGNILIDDVGYVSGLLFELDEHTEGAPGNLLIKQLVDSYELDIDYDDGIITERLSITGEVEKLLDFIKVITSIETVLPFISRPRKKVEGRRRLTAQLSREISQLRLPLKVEKLAKVAGKHEIWDVEYKYTRKEDNSEILILVADLGLKEPRERAAHVITLASDVLDVQLRQSLRRELRVVYSSNGDHSEATRRAVNIIDDYQKRIGYKAFNYSDPMSKSLFASITVQDLSPMKM
jgi:hypothetical protein